MSEDAQARGASQRFYAALNEMANGNAESMNQVWSHGEAVSTMHPIGGRQVGWDGVRESWTMVAQIASGGHVELRDQQLLVSGNTAYELGNEFGSITLAGDDIAVDHRVTNVYQRENGEWKIVHHHSDISPAMLDVLTRLQSGG
jgi:ketosteroid isomerase-like protein